jgi:hypothetical protein
MTDTREPERERTLDEEGVPDLEGAVGPEESALRVERESRR